MSSRQRLLLLLRKHPGVTVTELARDMAISGMGVRRHLSALASDGLVERTTCAEDGLHHPPERGPGAGRPPARWRLSALGREMFPRRYDALALDLMDELSAEDLAGALARRNDTQVAQYEAAIATCADLRERVAEVAHLRDVAGYQAEWVESDAGALVLTENNCAIHRVAERHPAVCTMELALLQRVLGPQVVVTRLAHAMSGDAMCAYCIRPVPGEPEP